MTRPMTIELARTVAYDASLRGDGRWWATSGATCLWVGGPVGEYRASLDRSFDCLVKGAPAEVAKIGHTWIKTRGALPVFRYRDLSGILYRARFLEACEEAWSDLVWYAPTRIIREANGSAGAWAAARVGDRWVAFIAPVVTTISECHQ